jgi:hypothetical protein
MSVIRHSAAVPYGVGLDLSAAYVADREAGSTLSHMAWLEAEAHAAREQLRGVVEERDRLRGLWRDEALVTQLWEAHMRGDVAAALRAALGGQ